MDMLPENWVVKRGRARTKQKKQMTPKMLQEENQRRKELNKEAAKKIRLKNKLRLEQYESRLSYLKETTKVQSDLIETLKIQVNIYKMLLNKS